MNSEHKLLSYNHRPARPEPTAERPRARFMTAIVALLFVTGTGCNLDSLLEAKLPGDITEGDLDSPQLARTVAMSAQGSFECALAAHIYYVGIWTGETQDGGSGRPHALLTVRSNQFAQYADHCTGLLPNWAPLQTARYFGARAALLLEGHPDNAIPNRAELIGRSRLYEAFSILLLSEAYCAVAFDRGPLLTRGDGFRLAAERFTTAMEDASRVSNPVAAAAIRNAALVGRARARLNLGEDAAVVADASQVDEGFVFNATYDATPPDRRNRLYRQLGPDQLSNEATVGARYRALALLNGVPDPRVPVFHDGRNTQSGGLPSWAHRKYTSDNAPIPVASWREAQIMIAEVEGGQTAVGIINRLRSTYNLPQFVSSNPAEIRAQVREERMRETFLQGQDIGNLLRWGGPWRTEDERGRLTSPENTCMHVPEFEVFGNPNFDSAPTTPT